MKRAFAFFLVAFFSMSVIAQTRRPTDAEFTAAFDNYIRRTLAKTPDVPGVAIAIVSGDKAIFVKTYGVGNLTTGVKADNNTLFYIAQFWIAKGRSSFRIRSQSTQKALLLKIRSPTR